MANPKGYTAPTSDRGKWLPVEPEVRLRRKFEEGEPDACWPWSAGLDGNGYGRFWNGERVVAGHRAVYEMLVGPIPEGLTLDHLCHNRDQACSGGLCSHRRCVNPAHLEAVPTALNKRRGKSPPSANARKTHCPRGHAYEGHNLMYGSTGNRRCRICVNEQNRLWAARRQAGTN